MADEQEKDFATGAKERLSSDAKKPFLGISGEAGSSLRGFLMHQTENGWQVEVLEASRQGVALEVYWHRLLGEAIATSMHGSGKSYTVHIPSFRDKYSAVAFPHIAYSREELQGLNKSRIAEAIAGAARQMDARIFTLSNNILKGIVTTALEPSQGIQQLIADVEGNNAVREASADFYAQRQRETNMTAVQRYAEAKRQLREQQQ